MTKAHQPWFIRRPFPKTVKRVHLLGIAGSGMGTYPAHGRAMLPNLAKATPVKRMGTESEIAAAICFLLSPAAAFITGHCLPVDGGAPLMPHHWPMPDHDRSLPFEGFHRTDLPDDLLALTKLNKLEGA